jgi:predicted phosphoadenosine phosphosulfate sulfurtransferase
LAKEWVPWSVAADQTWVRQRSESTCRSDMSPEPAVLAAAAEAVGFVEELWMWWVPTSFHAVDVIGRKIGPVCRGEGSLPGQLM